MAVPLCQVMFCAVVKMKVTLSVLFAGMKLCLCVCAFQLQCAVYWIKLHFKN